MRTRLVTKCSPDHVCSDKEITAIIEEAREVEKDKTITSYEFPNIEQMKTIIETAENYKGKWYHSKVVLKDYDYLSKEHETLTNRILELGEDNGIWVNIQIDMNEENTKNLKNLFT